MADLTQTPSNVRISSNAVVDRVVAGEGVSPGMPGYKKTSDDKYYKGVATSAAAAAVTGWFVGDADADDYVLFQIAGDIDIGATLVIGESYFVSNTAGKVMPSADVSTGEFVTYLGTATATDNLPVVINASGVARA